MENNDKPKYSKQIVLLLIILNVIFAAAVLIINFFGNDVSDTLIEKWFNFTSIEFITLGGIKSIDLGVSAFSDYMSKRYDKLARNDKPNKSDIEE